MIQLASTHPLSSNELDQRKHQQEELGKRCRQIFEEIKLELREKYNNWFIAIDPETRHYLLNSKLDDLLTQIRQDYPDGKLRWTLIKLFNAVIYNL